jgi:hypothetical protein
VATDIYFDLTLSNVMDSKKGCQKGEEVGGVEKYDGEGCIRIPGGPYIDREDELEQLSSCKKIYLNVAVHSLG